MMFLKTLLIYYEELQLVSRKIMWKMSILLSHYLIVIVNNFVLGDVLAKYCLVSPHNICYFGIHTAFPALFLEMKSVQNICIIFLSSSAAKQQYRFVNIGGLKQH